MVAMMGELCSEFQGNDSRFLVVSFSRHSAVHPHLSLPPSVAVSQCFNFGLSSRANARDLRFLAALEMTEEGKYDVSVLQHSLSRGKRTEGAFAHLSFSM